MQVRALQAGIATLALLGALAGCSEWRKGTGIISQRIGEVVHTPGTTTLDLARLTSFGWDRFFATEPGITREEVCRLVGAARNVCGLVVRIDKAPEDHVYLVFTLQNRVTHVELHALANGRFDMQFPAGGLPRGRAVFRVRRTSIGAGSGDTIVLEPL
jgi:hypothetical protein